MSINSGDPNLDAAIASWLKQDKNPKTLAEVKDDIEHARWEKFKKTMLHRQSFGTAGLRGRMGAGYTCMNDVVVIQTAQGLCSYLKKVCTRKQLDNGLVVGYDGRHNSDRFAELTAKVFVTADIKVHLFSTVCPTPLVSFATIYYQACGGVMVTASHNPKNDNGYKVYWSNGSQIIEPHDDNILDEILFNLEIVEEHWDADEIRSHELVSDCLEEVTEKYMEYIRSTLSEELLECNKESDIDIVYSAMHGVGYNFILKAFDTANIKAPISVPEQQDPDPDFPTVTFPNPEESECVDHSKRLAEKTNSSLVLINDPDADRLAVAEYDLSYKIWKVFTGNEMGALLGWWLLHQHLKNSPDSEEEVYVIASIVSSKMLKAIFEGKGQFVETLTGFKWMGNTTLLLKQQGKLPLFAFEEAIGYMCNARVPDKDGISAAVHVATLSSYLRAQGSSLAQKLQDLYSEYGYHVTLNSYFICYDPGQIKKIFRHIRNYRGPGLYPQEVGPCKIESITDFTTGVKIPDVPAEENHLRVLGTGLDCEFGSGEMIMFRCDNGLSVCVRTSGTEPKLKYYTELVCQTSSIGEQEWMKANLEIIVKEFIEDLLQPRKHGLLNRFSN